MIKNNKLKKLSVSEVRKKLKNMPDWIISKNVICREFQFDNFKKTTQFSMRIAKAADRINHHPNIFIHDYNHVWIESKTHKINGLTDKDIELAQAIENLKK